MNYTGNPRHLRARSRSTQKQYLHHQHARPPAIAEPPLLISVRRFKYKKILVLVMLRVRQVLLLVLLKLKALPAQAAEKSVLMQREDGCFNNKTGLD